jgi:hypothetical protein
MTFRPDQNNFGKGMWIDRFASASQQVIVQQTGGSNQRNNFLEAPDGIRHTFTLPSVPAAGNLQVFRNGQLLSAPDDFTISGAQVTFIITPAATDTIVAYYGGGTTRQSFSGAIDGNSKVFVFNSAPVANVLQFFWNGGLQHEGDDYTLVGNTITLTKAPEIGATLVAYF